MDLERKRSRWWSGSKKTGHREMERRGRTTSERERWEGKTDGGRGRRRGEGGGEPAPLVGVIEVLL